MSRRMLDTDRAYRVRLVQTGVVEGNDGRTSVTVYGPYSSIGTARAQAHRVKAKAADWSPAWTHEVTVERATGWETV